MNHQPRNILINNHIHHINQGMGIRKTLMIKKNMAFHSINEHHHKNSHIQRSISSVKNHFLNNAEIPAIIISSAAKIPRCDVPITTRTAEIMNPTPAYSKSLLT